MWAVRMALPWVVVTAVWMAENSVALKADHWVSRMAVERVRMGGG